MNGSQDIMNQIPVDTQISKNTINRLTILERLDRSEQSYRMNGGYSSEQVKAHIDEMAEKLP